MTNTDYILETINELESFAQQTNQTQLVARAQLTREIYYQELKFQSNQSTEKTYTPSKDA
jgi:hypothetical protein